MRKQLLDQLAQAAYNARLAALSIGVYPKRAFQIPSHDQCYVWDDLPGSIANPTQWVYRKEGEAVLDAFFAHVFEHGSEEAKIALEMLLRDARDLIMTDEEQAVAEGGTRQVDTSP